MDFDLGALREGLLRFIVVVCSLALHEWGHAFMADKLGDDTPRLQGRVTLYPPAHIDWIGTVLIPALSALGVFGTFSMIGWAKPVYTNPANFRRRMFDQALVTIAGPGVNVLLALLATTFAAVSHGRFPQFTYFCEIVLIVNVSLFVFNMLPIPPLDGSKFLMYWFGVTEESYFRAALYGDFILLVLINLQPFRDFVGMLIRYALVPFNFFYGILA